MQFKVAAKTKLEKAINAYLRRCDLNSHFQGRLRWLNTHGLELDTTKSIEENQIKAGDKLVGFFLPEPATLVVKLVDKPAMTYLVPPHTKLEQVVASYLMKVQEESHAQAHTQTGVDATLLDMQHNISWFNATGDRLDLDKNVEESGLKEGEQVTGVLMAVPPADGQGGVCGCMITISIQAEGHQALSLCVQGSVTMKDLIGVYARTLTLSVNLDDRHYRWEVRREEQEGGGSKGRGKKTVVSTYLSLEKSLAENGVGEGDVILGSSLGE